jgi:hypothetical protein
MNSTINALPWAGKADGDSGHPTGAVIETEFMPTDANIK